MEQQSLNRLTLVALYIVLALGIAFTLALNWLLPLILRGGAELGFRYWGSFALWTLGSVAGLLILWTLIAMMKSLAGDPFSEANVACLFRMGVLALGMGACSLFAFCLIPRPLYLATAVAECLCGLFSLVLRGVFARAVAFKQENDLTI